MSETPEERIFCDKSNVQAPRIVDSDELFQGRKLLVIQHAGENYRLILTRNNRLILQK